MRRPILAIPILLAALCTAGAAEAKRVRSGDGFTEQAVVSCLSGATISGVTTAFVAIPLAHSGIGTGVAASAVAASAGVGCGLGVAYTAAATGYSWAWRSFVAPPDEPEIEDLPTAPLPPERPRETLIHAAFP
ncbi:hypothetical protein [Azospirillum thermophilum]|uniref:Uncharacterized protein n=1 Tax=Azospirillum thermophilum TaxID=2202148 RepID=A0A2S2CR22_9PROT|nr:hypothetical protein [Azospirillum thermophilum]AWK86936.1 hypothetical protein DEW08_12470 [Azospirillum thermophilum]